jgi:hypothetical protein
MPDTRTASCNCGSIRIETRGQPVRVGLCHCTTCRKGGGAPFTANVIWCAEDVTVHGETASWKASTVTRHFCPRCGSPLFGVSDGTDEIAIGLGAFDVSPTDLVPTYELWTGRREKWFRVVRGTEQFAGNRTAVA